MIYIFLFGVEWYCECDAMAIRRVSPLVVMYRAWYLRAVFASIIYLVVIDIFLFGVELNCYCNAMAICRVAPLVEVKRTWYIRSVFAIVI